MTPAEAQPRNATNTRNDRTVGELFNELAVETSTLVRQEVKLATAEMSRKASYALTQVLFIAAGLLLGVVGLLSLLFALIFGLATVIELWKSALLVGIVSAVIAVAAVAKGLSALREMDLTPRQTIQTIKEDKRWIQQHVG
jgi:hypothetical protein